MPRLISGSFATGGTILLAGTALHPHEHVNGGTLQEQFHAMFSDSHWYPAHVLLLVGLALMTVAVVGLARTTPVSLPGRTTRFAAIASVVATAAMVLHLVAKLDDAHITAGENTPLLYTHAAVETVTVPMFGIAFALLAAAGGRSRWREALERGAVTDRRRDRHVRRRHQPRHHAGERSVHPGDDDHHPGRPQEVEAGEHPVQPGHADVDDELGGPPEVAGGEHRLARDRQVGRARADDHDPSSGRVRRAGRPDHQPRHVVHRSVGQHLAQHGTVVIPAAGEQRHPVCTSALAQSRRDGAHLGGGLALAVDRLGIARARLPSEVELGHPRDVPGRLSHG